MKLAFALQLTHKKTYGFIPNPNCGLTNFLMFDINFDPTLNAY